MTKEKQRIFILKYLGWTELERKGILLRGTSPDGKENQIAPNHLVNLNAMHEAEKTLIPSLNKKGCTPLPSLYWQYSGELLRLTTISNSVPFHATSIQRAEAFLRTLNLWEND